MDLNLLLCDLVLLSDSCEEFISDLNRYLNTRGTRVTVFVDASDEVIKKEKIAFAKHSSRIAAYLYSSDEIVSRLSIALCEADNEMDVDLFSVLSPILNEFYSFRRSTSEYVCKNEKVLSGGSEFSYSALIGNTRNYIATVASLLSNISEAMLKLRKMYFDI